MSYHLSDEIRWEYENPFTPAEALALIDREGFKEAVQSFLIVERQLRQMYAYWLADHRGFGNRGLRARKREEMDALREENGRRITLLHIVNDAVYGRVS